MKTLIHAALAWTSTVFCISTLIGYSAYNMGKTSGIEAGRLMAMQETEHDLKEQNRLSVRLSYLLEDTISNIDRSRPILKVLLDEIKIADNNQTKAASLIDPFAADPDSFEQFQYWGDYFMSGPLANDEFVLCEKVWVPSKLMPYVHPADKGIQKAELSR